MKLHELYPTLRHLQITFKPAEYQQLLRRYMRGAIFVQYDAGQYYWKRLPTYIVSRCPFCSATYTSQLDTHSLLGNWSTHPDSWNSVGDEEHQTIGCKHFVAVQTFVNLNKLIPTELDYFENNLDVSFIMPPFVPDDIPSVAVMHNLPICRIEDNTFVPRYTAYIVTYYALDPVGIWMRRRAENDLFRRGDPEAHTTMLFTSGEAHVYPESWNLELWVSRGKLQWLDPSANLSLRGGPPQAIPYRMIQGYRRPITVRNGEIEFGV